MSAPPRFSGTTWSITYPGHPPDDRPVAGQGLPFLKAVFDWLLRATRPRESRGTASARGRPWLLYPEWLFGDDDLPFASPIDGATSNAAVMAATSIRRMAPSLGRIVPAATEPGNGGPTSRAPSAW